MKKITFVLLLLMPVNVHAGQLGTSVLWISGSTAEGDLVLNNDDYTGEFADNPNKFKINEQGPCCPGADVRQSIVATERVIPTIASGGITEYAMSLGANAPGFSFDNVFQVQLGFGTGDDFVRAQDMAPDLRFDLPELLSPAIEDFFWFGDIPLLKLLDHQTDTLVYQGSSTTGEFNVCCFSSSELFMLPLDIPDLPESVRDLYAADALAGLAATDIPFTIRVNAVKRAPIDWIPGDADHDSDVDFVDFLALSSHFGEMFPFSATVSGMWEHGDFDLNGTVEFADFLALSENFGIQPMVPAAAVPEPSTGLLAVVACCLAMMHRKSRMYRKSRSALR